mmetsp:Transcript_18005/g.27280  ORF Transcript_18005/g.27280 Transcript_18005/m.27280 type:complete len:506 (-) Transcript_18005:111-1628(-)|eukprot:CAMPEP_0178913750 /NCGR_PEP_ID=MMETSP0786-20121207/11017_1 /TAXON_ID=186022 /ORGANISM="Thalassionema frauenfeldii, Strain CCMP 1798" /LENGTH=505 /DNA_ID=CAMNT_0020586529 /DNA_START=55 /DNA_END=1569 /DNA_ORIENTATION=-
MGKILNVALAVVAVLVLVVVYNLNSTTTSSSSNDVDDMTTHRRALRRTTTTTTTTTIGVLMTPEQQAEMERDQQLVAQLRKKQAGLHNDRRIRAAQATARRNQHAGTIIANKQFEKRLTQQLLPNHHNNNVNETTTTTILHTAAQSYCDGNDLIEYPMPLYGACPPDSILNIIPFHGGMTNGLKFVLLGALLSFEENRCFMVSEEDSHLNPGYHNHQDGATTTTTTTTEDSSSFIDHFFEGIGLPRTHPFVKAKLERGMYQVREWREYWDNLRRRRTEHYHFRFDNNNNNTSAAYHHPAGRVNGLHLKRHLLRHLWHLKPEYRNATCRALQDQAIFQTDYIAMSIRRGDKMKEEQSHLNNPPTMADYIAKAERLIPYMFPTNNNNEEETPPPPKIFVATDDCTCVSTLRKARPQWLFISQCDQLSETQNGFDILDVPKMNEAQREEHFRKFFVELYALALSKVFIGVAYTNVAWFAYMMRPNVEKSTFILLDKSPFENDHTLANW